MKDATSELNAGIIVLLAIGVLIAFFYYTIWPIIKNDLDQQCSKAICDACPADKYPCEFVKCHMSGNPNREFECAYKG